MSRPAAGAPKAATRKIAYEEGVREWLVERGALALSSPLCKVEGSTMLTWNVIQSMGRGSTKGWRLLSTTNATDYQEASVALATDLIKARPKLGSLGPSGGTPAARAKNALLAVLRMLDAIVDSMREPTTPRKGAATDKDGTAYVVTQNETERQFTNQAFDVDAASVRRQVLVNLYNLELTPHELPEQRVLKKTAYWVLMEGCFPDPDKVTLETMRRSATDSNCTLFRRLLNSVMLAGAGEKAAIKSRDEGSGELEGHGIQWCHAEQVIAVLKEMEEVRDQLTNAQVGGVCRVMIKSLHKATLRGKETLSLALSKAIAKMPEFIALHTGRAPPGTGDEASEDPDKLGGKKRKRGGAKKKKAEQAKKAAELAKKGGQLGARFKDAAGEEGPNGLPRMKGGNPAGGPCKAFAEKGKCPYATCSFSHEK